MIQIILRFIDELMIRKLNHLFYVIYLLLTGLNIMRLKLCMTED